MPQLTKTEAVVLRKTEFRNSSLIVQLYTKKFGKISAMLKGVRSPKSAMGSKVDVMNYTEVVIYQKPERELQLVTQATLKNHYPNLKEDFDKLKYASAICELILYLIPEHETNDKIFRGIIRIFSLMDKKESLPKLLFAKFLLFFIKELGYEISTEKCAKCGQTLDITKRNAFSFEDGIICMNCYNQEIISQELSKELLELFKCINTKKKTCKPDKVDNIIFIMEKYLTYHIPEFKGLRTLKIL